MDSQQPTAVATGKDKPGCASVNCYAAMLDDIEIIRQKIASARDSCDGSNTGLAIDDALWSALMALNRAEAAAKNAA